MNGSFNIVAAHDFKGPFGPGAGGNYGSDNGDVNGAWVAVGGTGNSTNGTFSPSPAYLDSIEVAGVYTIDPAELGTLYFFVILVGTYAQNAFTSISFTDNSSNVETYNTSAATFDSATWPGYSAWQWAGPASIPFTSGNTYTMNYVGGAPTFAVPAISGYTPAQGAAILASDPSGLFSLGTVSNTNGFPVGIISAQSPTAGTPESTATVVTASVNAGPVPLGTKFVSPKVSKAIMLANPGTINPRIYPPEEDTTARVQPQRLPI